MTNENGCFIRHNLDGNQKEYINKLKNDKKIAYFFDQNTHKQNVEQYLNLKEDGTPVWPYKKKSDSAVRTACWYFQELSIKGGWIWTEYGTTDFYIGKVEPNTPVEFNNDNLLKSPAKTLQLSDIKEFSYTAFPCLSVLRGQSTIFGLSKEKLPIVKAIYESSEDNPIKAEINLLTPQAQEQLCYIFLQKIGININDSIEKVDYCYFPVGRALPGFDIMGITETNKKIIAQVTFSSVNGTTKLENFVTSANEYIKDDGNIDTIFIMFSMDKDKELINYKNIYHHNLEEVFNEIKTLHNGKYIIRNLIGITYLKF